jgi:EAL domain-containing protein (putative c-di-GMP-specific phosphodiesterase class I)
MRKLQSFGADKFQGYLLGRPLASAKFEHEMRRFATHRSAVAQHARRT